MSYSVIKNQKIKIFCPENADSAVCIAANNLAKDFFSTMGVDATVCTYSQDAPFSDTEIGTVIICSCEDGQASDGFTFSHKEEYYITVKNDALYIYGQDRRGIIYGIYEVSGMLGVSPWYYFADVPAKKKDTFTVPDGFVKSDFPSVEYRGIFINDEEELDNWAKAHMNEETIGVNTYEKIFELLLRLKANYIWPAMHVNSFNVHRENGELANRMGMVVGTSHCDMLMRSNNREWVPWITQKGYEGIEYDYSIPGRNREVLNEYWRESVIQNKDFEVSYTLGMRGIHDSGFETKSLEGLTGEELQNAKIDLLQTVINAQEKILDEELDEKPLKIFVPYKEVLPLYDNGLEVPDDLTLIWTNDNYGYVRRYPGAREKGRAAGNGLYYHNSYWAPPGASYLFINSIPLAHTKNELLKAWNEDIKKLWVLNVGAIKPLEQEISFYLDFAWNVGKENAPTDDVDEWLADFVDNQFAGGHGKVMAKLLNDFSQITNVRKIELMESDVFSQTAYGDEAAWRINRLKEIYLGANAVYEHLADDEKDAFFQMFLLKIHASYITNLMYYYADRSKLMVERGAFSDADRYCDLVNYCDDLRRKLIKYYNEELSDGKWNLMVTPEDFPPPRTAMHPAAVPALRRNDASDDVTDNAADNTVSVNPAGGRELILGRNTRKYFELFAKDYEGITYTIEAPEWVKVNPCKGTLECEQRIFVEAVTADYADGVITVHAGRDIEIPVSFRNGYDDGIITLEADDYTDVSGYKLIDRLGRDHGKLIEAETPGNYVNYEFELNCEYEPFLEIHRFPALNSTCEIGVHIKVDEKEVLHLVSESNDEWRGSWKTNIKNSVDKLTVNLGKMAAGKHTITLCDASLYFSFSRIVLYTGDREENMLGVFTGSNCVIPKCPEGFEKYKGLSLSRRKMLVASYPECGNNSLPDVDMRVEDNGKGSTVPASFYTDFADAFSEIDGDIRIDAARALSNSEGACMSGNWDYCRSESYNRTGIAMHIRKKGIDYTDILPELNYRIDVLGGDYTVWILTKSDEQKDADMGIAIDGRRVSDSDIYYGFRIGRYCAEQVYRWVPVIKLSLERGVHTLSVLAKHSNTRFDRIFITRSKQIPPVDSAWVR